MKEAHWAAVPASYASGAMPATGRRSCCAAALAHSAAAPSLASAATRCGLRCHDGTVETMLQQSALAGGASRPAGGALPGGRSARRPSGTLQRPALTGILRAARCGGQLWAHQRRGRAPAPGPPCTSQCPAGSRPRAAPPPARTTGYQHRARAASRRLKMVLA